MVIFAVFLVRDRESCMYSDDIQTNEAGWFYLSIVEVLLCQQNVSEIREDLIQQVCTGSMPLLAPSIKFVHGACPC